jgi:hypothetical protein
MLSGLNPLVPQVSDLYQAKFCTKMDDSIVFEKNTKR